MSGDYGSPDVEEMLYADGEETLSTELTKVTEGTVPDGYEGMIVSIAVSADKTATIFIKRDGKQYYDNGLNCIGLSSKVFATAEDEGVDKEVFLGVRLKEKGKWELGMKSTVGTPTIGWRLRVRHFKKGA